MLEDLFDSKSLEWVRLEEGPDKALRRLRSVFFKVVFCLQNKFMEVWHVVCLKGHSAIEHSIEDDSR
jgi:hypothetical protein